jgi:transcriptional regulator with XRE-family HTH domain
VTSIAKRRGAVLRRRRRERGLTLAQLSKLSGVDTSQLSKIERGVGGGSEESLSSVAYELGWSLGDLYAVALSKRSRSASFGKPQPL